MNYKDIATWKGQQTQEGFHILPFFRVQLTAARNVDIVIGNIYGKSNHHLIEPLYNPETSLSTDPEAGLQILWRNKFMDFVSYTTMTNTKKPSHTDCQLDSKQTIPTVQHMFTFPYS